MSQLKIMCDNREPPEIITHLEEMGVQVERKQLEVGDYVVSENVGIERKSGADFVASLADGRLFEQVDRLQSAYPRPLYILENFSSAFEREGWEERRKHVYGALCYISVRRGIPVVPTESLEETSLLLERIASWEQEEHDDPLLARSAPRSLTVPERQQFLLEGLYDTGPKKADLLLKEFSSPLHVFQAIAHSEVIFTKTGNPKGVDGPMANIKGFGPKYVIKNQGLIRESNEEDVELAKKASKKSTKSKQTRLKL